MNSEHGLLGAALAAALLAAGCTEAGQDTDESLLDDSAEMTPLASEAPVRPAGWAHDSHDPSAAPDYAHVFPDDQVQRIDIELPAATLASMYDDLTQRVGAPSASSGFGGFAGLSSSSPAGLAACATSTLNQPCTFLGLQGTCGQQTTLGFGNSNPNAKPQPLTCREADTGGALDMVPGDPVAVDATVRVDGATWTHVGMRFKGNSSLVQPWKMGLKKLGVRLDFDRFEKDHPETENQRYYGFSKLVLNPAHMDASLIREKLASDLLRESKLPAARAAFYRVYVKSGDQSVYWGLYTALEDPADVLPGAQFADGSGNIYKPDGTGADFTKLDKRGFEKKNHSKEADYGDVERAITALHASRTDAAKWRSDLEKVFDVDGFLRTLAFNRSIDNFDSYGTYAHNYYLYGDPSHDGRLVWINWDMNFTWAGFGGGFGGFGGGGVMMDSTSARWPLIRFLLDDAVYRAKYRDALTGFIRGPYTKEAFDAHARRLHTLIAPYVTGADGEKAPFSYLGSVGSFDSSLQSLISAADRSRTAVETALAKDLAPKAPPPATTPAAPAPEP